MEMIVQLETSKFEDCKKEPISFAQDSVKTCDPFSIQQKNPSRQTFLIGNFCSDFFVQFPVGAKIIFTFEIFSCFSKV